MSNNHARLQCVHLIRIWKMIITPIPGTKNATKTIYRLHCWCCGEYLGSEKGTLPDHKILVGDREKTFNMQDMESPPERMCMLTPEEGKGCQYSEEGERLPIQDMVSDPELRQIITAFIVEEIKGNSGSVEDLAERIIKTLTGE